MSMLSWSDAYSVDIQEIDEQHKCIVNYINELYEALAHKNNRELVAEVIHKLVEYTIVHFAVEETLMRIFDYADYDPHKASHDRITQRVMAYQERFLQGDDKVGMELLLFLKGWLFDHIQQEDRDYSAALRAAGIRRRWMRRFW